MKAQKSKDIKVEKIEIIEVKTIEHPSLNSYLNQKCISLSTARKSCMEVLFKMSGQDYLSIGFKNDSGGWELENECIKASTLPEDISFIKNGGSSLVIIQGVFDLMTLQILEPSLHLWSDVIVLNSPLMVEKAKRHLKNYSRILLFLDMSFSGRKATEDFMESHQNCSDRSDLYFGFENLNDWLVSINE